MTNGIREARAESSASETLRPTVLGGPGSPTGLFLASLGLLAGLASGFLGIGGGLIIVPALTLLAGYPIKRAVGASLGAIVLVSLVGVLVEFFVKGANIYWSVAAIVTGGALFGARLGARILPVIPERALRALFAASLLAASLRMFTGVRPTPGLGLTTVAVGTVLSYAVAFPVGVLAGLTSTMFGLGGGIVTVPGLTLLFSDISFHAARATSLVTLVPTSGFGAYQHGRLGTLDLGLVKRMSPTAVLGSSLGVVLVNLVPPVPCRVAFATLLIAVAVCLLLPPRASPRAHRHAPFLQLTISRTSRMWSKSQAP